MEEAGRRRLVHNEQTVEVISFADTGENQQSDRLLLSVLEAITNATQRTEVAQSRADQKPLAEAFGEFQSELVKKIKQLGDENIRLQGQLKEQNRLHRKEKKAFEEMFDAQNKRIKALSKKLDAALPKINQNENKVGNFERSLSTLKERFDGHGHQYFAPRGSDPVLISTYGPNK
jgi:predicted nuclease with TOPRIM domain